MKKVVLLLAILLALNSCKEDSVIIKSAFEIFLWIIDRNLIFRLYLVNSV